MLFLHQIKNLITMKKTFLLFIAIVFGALQCAMAAPLKNMEVRLTQPDGQVIHCFASGDEYYNYLHDANGYTIVKGADGFYCYAVYDNQGQVVPSAYRVGSVEPAKVGLQPNVKISAEEYYQRRMNRERYNQPIQRPRGDRELNHGRYNNLVVFIRFAGDTYHTTPFSDVDSMFNASNYESVSMHNYYHHASYNQLDLLSFFYPEPDGETILSYEDIYPKEYYMPYDPVTNPMGYHDGETADREFSMLERAIYYVADQVPDTLDLDYNGDGNVDNVVFIIKGQPGEWASLLWPHRWCIYDRYVPLNGLRVYDFNLQLEQGGYFNVSTFCHEMFHSLGAPDLYHYSGGIDAVGSWDLMCSNASPPQHSGVYMKYKYGNWVDDIPEITGQYGTYEIEADAWEGNRRNAYRIATSNPYQFLLVEYRNDNTIFETKLPGGGLLIYRIDTRYDGNAGWNGTDQFDEVYLFRPGGSINEAGNLNHANFCAEHNRTEFSQYTDPFVFFTNGQVYDWGERIYNISTKGDKISFTYGPLEGDGAQPGPEGLTAHVNSLGHQVELAWSPVEGADSYRIYRDGQEIVQGVTDNAYVHPYTGTDNGYHIYSVASVTEGVVSAHSEQWVILGNYETLRLSLTSDSPYGTKGGELEVSFDHPLMPTQYFTLYEGTQKDAELYVPANTEVTLRWNAGFDPDSEGIHVTAKHLNENGESTLVDLDGPASGVLVSYTVADEGLGSMPPQQLTATANGTQIQLSWTIPVENHDFVIYRDGKLHQNITGGYAYLDANLMRSGTHSYHVESLCGTMTSWNPESLAYATVMNYYCEPPQNLQGTYFNDGHVELSWDAPQFVGHGMIAYDANQFVDQIGTSNHKWGIKIEPEHLALFAGHPLTEIEIFDCSSGQYTFTIYNGALTNNYTTLFTQQRQMEGSHEWVRFALDEAVAFDPTQPLWICVATSGTQSPIPCCDYVGDDNSCLIKSGSIWKPATQFNMNYSWLLRAYTSPLDNTNIAYNLYWGPEDGGENEMVLGYGDFTETQANHITNDNLRYCVTALWDGRETEFSLPVFLGPTVGIEEPLMANTSVVVFPNPVKSQLTIQGKALRHVRLISLTGATVFESQTQGESLVIGMDDLPQGLYLLRIQHEDGVEVVKVMKQ